MTKRKAPHEKLKPGPKPGFKLARAAKATVAVAAVAQAAPAKASTDVLQPGRNIKTMPEAELRLYARQIGESQRDATTLAVDRLRANCELTLMAFVENL